MPPGVRRTLTLLVALLLAGPTGVRADTAQPAVTRVTPLLSVTVADLPPPPPPGSVPRIILTPGASDEAEMLGGPRLIFVESGHIGFIANGNVPIFHTDIEPVGAVTTPTATSTPTPVPTPTPLRSP